MNKIEIADIIVAKLNENKVSLKIFFEESSDEITTRYFCLDNLLPEELALDTYKGFPDDDTWFRRSTFREKKLTYAKIDGLDSKLPANVTDSFHDPRVVNLVSEIVSIQDLESDSSLYAGGISRMDQTHFLNPHIDNSHDSNRKRYRRLNLLYYVAPGIEEKDGGNLEFWDQHVTNPLKIASKFNRLVVMETTSTSWHSVDPVVSDISRCCVSNYYFSKSSPTGKDYYHVTSFLGRPGQTGRRIYGRVDNFLRRSVSKITGISRGKGLTRNEQA